MFRAASHCITNHNDCNRTGMLNRGLSLSTHTHKKWRLDTAKWARVQCSQTCDSTLEVCTSLNSTCTCEFATRPARTCYSSQRRIIDTLLALGMIQWITSLSSSGKLGFGDSRLRLHLKNPWVRLLMVHLPVSNIIIHVTLDESVCQMPGM